MHTQQSRVSRPKQSVSYAFENHGFNFSKFKTEANQKIKLHNMNYNKGKLTSPNTVTKPIQNKALVIGSWH